ncbi:MAG: glycoside hydrolase family 3 protein [bacterium]|nr:glycoside hydrolase family 3 protein [bacterium]
MTLDPNRLGQLIMLGVPQAQSPEDSWAQTLKTQIEQGFIGGVLLFRENIVSKAQAAELVEFLQKAVPDGSPPLLISIDQEGGAVQRFSSKNGGLETPKAEDITAAKTPEEAQVLYEKMAQSLTSIGVNWNFGPVVDLKRGSPIIEGYGRSYGKSPSQVVPYAKAFIAAHKKAGIHTCLKHFPGHGSAPGDTHEGFVNVGQHWMEEELAPYGKLIQEGMVDSIMVAHVVSPLWGMRPATLSEHVIQDWLRIALNFEGVVITDDLHMGAMKEYSREEAPIRALKAGCDMVILSNHPGASKGQGVAPKDLCLGERVVRKVRQALEKDVLNEASLGKSLERISQLKESLNKPPLTSE